MKIELEISDTVINEMSVRLDKTPEEIREDLHMYLNQLIDSEYGLEDLITEATNY